MISGAIFLSQIWNFFVHRSLHYKLDHSPYSHGITPDAPFATFDKQEEILRFFEVEGKEIITLCDTNCDFSSENASMIKSKSHVPCHINRLEDLYLSLGL